MFSFVLVSKKAFIEIKIVADEYGPVLKHLNFVVHARFHPLLHIFAPLLHKLPESRVFNTRHRLRRHHRCIVDCCLYYRPITFILRHELFVCIKRFVDENHIGCRGGGAFVVLVINLLHREMQ